MLHNISDRDIRRRVKSFLSSKLELDAMNEVNASALTKALVDNEPS